MDRWIMHVDMDAFFASVEQYRNHPELIGQPVCVGHDPKKGNGRGVVRAVSYEARAFGIHSGMPVSRAYRLCPDAIFVSGEFSNYSIASGEFMEILARYADGGRVRRASIDEAYIDVTFGVQDYESPVDMAREIQAAIRQETNLPCSIGIAPNMSVAKVATGTQKPNGITLVGPDPQDIINFLAPMKVQALNGVGAKTAERLNNHGIDVLEQIQNMTIPELWPAMGRGSSWIHKRACGIDDRPLLDNGPRIRKSISKDRTFMVDIKPEAIETVHETISGICERIAEKLKNKSLQFRTVTIKLRYSDYTTIQRSRSIPVCTDDRNLLEKMALNIFDHERKKDKHIRLIGVKVSSLTESSQQASITDYF
ncbi:MAG: DNA polymerase IV [Candidatus Thorarchaeota archaeon]|nr:DNA polymerase IV [Candidatus Thorarchaeota archaeon]